MMSFRKELEEKINASGKYYRYHFPEYGPLTYVGVLIECFEPEDEFDLLDKEGAEERPRFIIQGWDTGTISEYSNDYVKVILPEIDRNKPLESYTKDDFDTIKARIRIKNPDLKLKTLTHFDFILERVYRVGVMRGIIDDSIGLIFAPVPIDLSDSDESVARLLLRPKSLSLAHERNILKSFKDSDICKMKGEVLGAYLQFFTGGRNEEIAGSTYGDLKILPLTGRMVLYLFKTSRGSEGRLSLRMKTSNARRVVPIFGFLAKRLVERMDYIQELFPDVDVTKLQIACRGEDFLRPMNPRELTNSGRNLIMENAPKKETDERMLKTMLANLSKEGIPVGEKSPTAYLFRRNYATHLHNLGLEQSVREFLIGHELLSPNDSRHEFASMESLERIHELFDKHPFNFFFSDEEDNHFKHEVLTGNRVDISLEPGIRYRLMLNEPNDGTSFELDENRRNDFMVSVSDGTSLKDTVDISGLVNPSYLPEAKKKEE